MAHGGEDEKKEPSREKGEKALWGAEGAGKRRRGRSRGVALTRGGTTRDCMTEVSKAASLKYETRQQLQHAHHATSSPAGRPGSTGETSECLVGAAAWHTRGILVPRIQCNTIHKYKNTYINTNTQI